ncbi:CotH kinase family protein [Emticicia sp. 21SJ11W-3]|uniref:CotH kinase family protein n=1 Tax=Emticicia sp. 21SJ11W-3 TaxID=2916755 RepID=UPI0020A03848|nr:CotH kinase family protein [Emticicia sp. 21SJ11W-3]UTA69788.1 CotH kinase family protein [Emticicia sp. 21SJ11W-3]
MKRQITRLLMGFLLWATVSCKTSADDIDPIKAGLIDWTAETHGNKVSPDYEVVFPQDKINTVEITLTAENWAAIRTDMVAKAGKDFGTGGNGQPGGGQMPGGGNAPPGGNGGGGLDIIPGDPIYVPVSLKHNGKEWYKVGFRLKGNNSLSQAWSQGIYKLPFKLQFDEFEDDYPEIKNQRFYGFKELSMAPGHNDNSLMRDKLVSDLFRSAGIPAARTSFCKVYINFGEGLKYCGVYTMIEVVDDTMVANQFGEENGNIYKPESTFQSFAEANFEKKNNEEAADYTDVKNVVSALNSTDRTTSPAQWRANLEKSFNVDHFLKYLAINNTIVNWDAYGAMAHNYYLYTPASTGKVTWIPWDFNLSMTTSAGNQQGGGANGRAVSLEMTEVANNWPLIRYLADDPVYLAKYKSYVKEFASTYFTSAQMNTIIDKHYNLIAPYVIGAEPEQTKYTFLANASAFTSAVSQLKQHVASRTEAVKAYLK